MSTIPSVPMHAASVGPSSRSSRARFFHRFRRSRLGTTGAVLLAIVVCCALGAPWIAAQNPLALNPAVRLQPPGAGHWFGTDNLGRDIFSRVIYGSRLSLEVGSLVVLATAAIGICSGIVAGYFRGGRRRDHACGRRAPGDPAGASGDRLDGRPGTPRQQHRGGAHGRLLLPQLIRVVRSQVLVLREALFAEAAKSAGASDRRIAFLHVLPNAMSVVIIQSTVTFADAVLTEAGLSYLGVGEPPGVPSWGNILADGRNYMLEAPWMTVFPGLAIVICVLGLNLLGDGLRDVLDPRTRGQ